MKTEHKVCNSDGKNGVQVSSSGYITAVGTPTAVSTVTSTAVICHCHLFTLLDLDADVHIYKYKGKHLYEHDGLDALGQQ